MIPRFLTLAEVLRIHESQLERFGGQDGVREMSLLEAAVAMPQAAFGGQYLHDGLAAMAAAYLFHIGQNQSFLDGNKRTATAAAVMFLELNGVDFNAPPELLTNISLSVGAGSANKSQLTEFFRQYVPHSAS